MTLKLPHLVFDVILAGQIALPSIHANFATWGVSQAEKPSLKHVSMYGMHHCHGRINAAKHVMKASVSRLGS